MRPIRKPARVWEGVARPALVVKQRTAGDRQAGFASATELRSALLDCAARALSVIYVGHGGAPTRADAVRAVVARDVFETSGLVRKRP
jgi:hypothetical protein